MVQVRTKRKQNPKSRGKRWTWTINNYTNDDLDQLPTMVGKGQPFSYICYGLEICPSTGTPHLQGYLECWDRLRTPQVSKLLPRAYLVLSGGTPKENYTYCSKNDDFRQFGTISKGSGHRSDLDALHSDLDEVLPLRVIATRHFTSFIRYQRGITAYRNIVAPRRTWETELHVFEGKTLTGKTRYAIEQAGDLDDLWIAPAAKLQWFDGYDGQSNILIDEFSGSTCSIKLLLRLADRIPMQVPIKGGFTQFLAKKIYITSNVPIDQWYPFAHDEHVAAMKRRFTRYLHFDHMTWNQLHFFEVNKHT